jgi:DNA-binding CsgD family transcriptional regulator
MSKSIPQGSAESTDEFWKPQIPISTDNARGGSAPGAIEGGVSRQVDGRATPRDIEIALTYGLELARCGAMLVGVDGCLQLANRAALAILDKKDGISLERTGLAAERASDTRLLHQLLRDAINAPQSGEPKGSPIMLPRKIARTALIVRVVPGPGLDCWPGTENRAALLTLYDEDKGVDVDEGVLCKLYGLTRGEAALAAILLQGKSIEEAAAQLFISPHTARTHLKRIFMKTDTHRQTELVVRMFSAVL